MYRLVNVQRGSYEWSTVLSQFRIGAPHANVRQILRNQVRSRLYFFSLECVALVDLLFRPFKNRSLWTWFYLKRYVCLKSSRLIDSDRSAFSAEIIAKNHGQVNERMYERTTRKTELSPPTHRSFVVVVVVQRLFHGSRKDATSIIVREGFDHRYAGPRPGAFIASEQHSC